jgi:type IV pilus assembly protein PilY1
MNAARNKSIAFAAGLAWAMLVNVAALADDTELFVGNAATGSQAKPNILFILDDSISMGPPADVVTQNNYDPAVTYAGACGGRQQYVFWSQDGNLPTCTSNNYFNWGALNCIRALNALNAPLGGVYAAGRLAQFNTGTNRWQTLSATQKNLVVECQVDRPDASIAWVGHGPLATPTPRVYARDAAPANNWSSLSTQEISWAAKSPGSPYTLYAGNYLNWVYTPGNLQQRITVMKEVASNVVQAMDGVNVGLMHFSDFTDGVTPGNDGAEVIHAMQDVTASRPALLTAINSLLPENSTPLEESLYEAYLYMTGGLVNYGTTGVAGAYVPGSTPLRYESPMDLECQKNHIVLLTDGEPRDDQGVSASIRSLVDAAGDTFADHIGSATCDLETYPPGFVTGQGGDCLDELAEFMYEGDLSPLNGQQNIVTHTVGFRVDTTMLQQTAQRGGGQYYTANDTAELTNALLSIITSVLDTQATFIAPTVSVNSFNQTRNLDDLYFSVFRPTATAHWPGNLKKYKLDGATGTIMDARIPPQNAIDPATGFFSTAARSYWSAGVDGEEVHLGGAANLIPTTRNVYTYLGNPALTHVSNAVIGTNLTIDNVMLNAASAAERTQVIAFIQGLDAADVDQDGVTTEPRFEMGDPLHAQPVSVVYGPGAGESRIYFATNDGYLHSIDTSTGIEQWAFLPEEFLGNQIAFMKNPQVGTGSKIYGIDGNLRVQMITTNSDGVIGAGEKVFLFVSMRRGGDVFYALDITQRDLPRVMWRKDGTSLPPADLPGIGQGFSSAMPARILVDNGSTQNADRTVVVIGGGYSPTQDGYTATTDTPVGNSIYIVDSENGTLLWHGSGNTGGTVLKTFNHPTKWRMDYSIPGDIRVLDLNGDRLADRMYAADMGGQVWRFDIRNGSPAAQLVDGGVIAKLGAAGIVTPTLADTRRFYYAPDVALASNNQYSFLHIGIGSGYREHPQELDNHNAFYALRDYKTFAQMTQAEYDAGTPIVPGNLVDVTTNVNASVPQGSPGWRIDLVGGGGWRGEKVLAETRTFNNRVFVTTFRPGTTGVNCHPALGTNRQYVMSLFTGAPINNRDGSTGTGPLTTTDRYTEWEGAPPPETIFIFTDQGINSCVGVECSLEDFPQFPIRTFWTQESIEGNP